MEQAQLKSLDDLIRAVATEAIRLCQQMRQEEAEEQSSASQSRRKRRAADMTTESYQALAVWQTIQRDPQQALVQQGFWRANAVDYAWQALRKLFPWIAVDVMMRDDEQGTFKMKQQYPEVCNRLDLDLDLLTVLHQANEEDAEHYDLMV